MQILKLNWTLVSADPGDYIGLDDILMLAAGQGQVCTNIVIIPDDIHEASNEAFAVCIGSDDPSVVVVFSKSVVTIIDDTGEWVMD
jgi:hypothetical protein